MFAVKTRWGLPVFLLHALASLNAMEQETQKLPKKLPDVNHCYVAHVEPHNSGCKIYYTTVTYPSVIRVLNSATPEKVKEQKICRERLVTSIGGKDDSVVFGYTSSKKLILAMWQLGKKVKQFSSIEEEKGPMSIALNEDATKIAMGTAKNAAINIVNLEWPQIDQFAAHAHNDAATSLVYSPDYKQLASASYDGKIKIWDLASKQCVQEINVNRNQHTEIAMHLDWSGNQIVFNINRNLEIRDIGMSGRLVSGCSIGWTDDPVAVRFCSEGKKIVSVWGNAIIHEWDLNQ